MHEGQAGPIPGRIAITGANGLVGSALAKLLTRSGAEVTSIVRRRAAAGNANAREAIWNPGAGTIDAASLEGLDAVVHLAGENIAAGRWTPALRQRLVASRVDGTRLLCRTLAALQRPPRVLISASATGFYGDRGELELDEESEAGHGFLADLCRRWEAETAAARDAAIRVVNLRIGVVMTPEGGALGQMLTPFRFGVGGRLGPGTQYMSWISMDDLLAAIVHCIATPSLDGPVNAVAPGPVTNAELTRSLADALHRPALLPVPAFALRALLGEMADGLLLASTRVKPRRLLASGFAFRQPRLDAALAAMLGAAQT
ncbi:MAG: TIGR01777 family oxidoreductase [Candidatus Binatia bacterium]